MSILTFPVLSGRCNHTVDLNSAAMKSRKRAHGISLRICKFRVGDLVYWRRNAEREWKKSHREVWAMHDDNWPKCEATEIPQRLVTIRSKSLKRTNQ